jgi:CD109 antigen
MAMAFRSIAPQPRMMMMDSAPQMELAMCDDSEMVQLMSHAVYQPKKIEIRKEFPETFIFDDFESDGNGTKVITKKVPDTITSWIITGFSMNQVTGLGITKQATKLNVFQPFFASTNLPYSIKRGEVVAISIEVFNYLETDQMTQVTLFNKDGEFEFVDASDDAGAVTVKKQDIEVERKKMVNLASNKGTAVSFLIRALKIGDILIKVIAESAVAGDGLEKRLKVKPEGIEVEKNEAVFIDLRSETKFSKTIEIAAPEDIVEGSLKVETSMIGDILGPSIDNLDKLM